MVFPDSNPKKGRFLILYFDDKIGKQFEWKENSNDLLERKKYLENHFGMFVHFAGEIAILKDLTNTEK